MDTFDLKIALLGLNKPLAHRTSVPCPYCGVLDALKYHEKQNWHCARCGINKKTDQIRSYVEEKLKGEQNG